MKTKLAEYAHLAKDKTSLIRATKVSIIVGIILNLINNPQLFEPSSNIDIHYGRIVLTFLVPFIVSLHSSVLAYKEK
jgi:hypothetical protein